MSTVDLRCGRTLHGRVIDNRWFEVKCKGRVCGYKPGMVILHTIDLETGEVVQTRKFSEPRNKEQTHAAQHSPASVRTA